METVINISLTTVASSSSSSSKTALASNGPYRATLRMPPSLLGCHLVRSGRMEALLNDDGILIAHRYRHTLEWTIETHLPSHLLEIYTDYSQQRLPLPVQSSCELQYLAVVRFFEAGEYNWTFFMYRSDDVGFLFTPENEGQQRITVDDLFDRDDYRNLFVITDPISKRQQLDVRLTMCCTRLPEGKEGGTQAWVMKVVSVLIKSSIVEKGRYSFLRDFISSPVLLKQRAEGTLDFTSA